MRERRFGMNCRRTPTELTSYLKIIGFRYSRNPRDLLDGKNTVLLLVCNNVPNYLAGNGFFVICEAVRNERSIAKHIDHAGHLTPKLSRSVSRLPA